MPCLHGWLVCYPYFPVKYVPVYIGWVPSHGDSQWGGVIQYTNTNNDGDEEPVHFNPGNDECDVETGLLKTRLQDEGSDLLKCPCPDEGTELLECLCAGGGTELLVCVSCWKTSHKKKETSKMSYRDPKKMSTFLEDVPKVEFAFKKTTFFEHG